MSGVTLHAVPVTPERFAPFGDVIQPSAASRATTNDTRFERFDALAEIDADGRRPTISIVRFRVPAILPHRFDMVERHPLGSQAFVPLSQFVFFVVVAPAGESVEAADLQAFVTNGRQGINYRRGVWHMPMIALEEGQQFLIVDRGVDGDNCEQHYLSEPVTLLVD